MISELISGLSALRSTRVGVPERAGLIILIPICDEIFAQTHKFTIAGFTVEGERTDACHAHVPEFACCLPEFQIGIGNEFVERPVRRRCTTMIRVHFGFKFLSTRNSAEPRVKSVHFASLQICGSK